MKPWLRLTGGKAKLAPRILSLIPASFETYFEPCVGGGAVAMALLSETPRRFKRMVIADTNPDLVAAWSVVKCEVEATIALLRTWADTPETFAAVRSLEPSDEVTMGARWIWLNRCSFNGLMRLNRAGRFNAPYDATRQGKRDVVRADLLRDVSRGLDSVEIWRHDVIKTLEMAGAGSCCYVDPPYPAQGSDAGNFTSYTATGFSLAQHRELRDACVAATLRGARVIVSMGSCYYADKLWRRPPWTVYDVEMRRNVSCKGDGRGAVSEMLITWEG